jgi:hypothetical protein
MNCSELASGLRTRLLHERDPDWIFEARRHAEQCPSCSQFLELHQLEEQLMELPAVEPSGAFLPSVMSRIALAEPRPIASARWFSPEVLRTPMVVLGAVILAAVYVVRSASDSWLAGFRPSAGLIRSSLLSTYLAGHSFWALFLGSVAALLVVSGLLLADPQARTNIPQDGMAT